MFENLRAVANAVLYHRREQRKEEPSFVPEDPKLVVYMTHALFADIMEESRHAGAIDQPTHKLLQSLQENETIFGVKVYIIHLHAGQPHKAFSVVRVLS